MAVSKKRSDPIDGARRCLQYFKKIFSSSLSPWTSESLVQEATAMDMAAETGAGDLVVVPADEGATAMDTAAEAEAEAEAEAVVSVTADEFDDEDEIGSVGSFAFGNLIPMAPENARLDAMSADIEALKTLVRELTATVAEQGAYIKSNDDEIATLAAGLLIVDAP